jgi:hypothetical protein
LISLETAKEKVWKSLEKFGKAWNFLGKIWKSWEKLGAAAIGCSTPQWAGVGWRAKPARRGGRKPFRKPLKANDRRKTAPAAVGSAVASAATRCAAPRAPRSEPCGARVGARELPLRHPKRPDDFDVERLTSSPGGANRRSAL